MEHTDCLDASQTTDRRYRLLVDAITDYAIYMLDPDGIIASWNAGAQRFKGYETAEILGQHFSRFYTEEDRRVNLPARALETAAREGRFEQEGWRVRKDGTRFWAQVVIDPIRDPSGKLLGYAKVTRDLTERKAAAHALRSSEEQFQLLVQGVTDYAIYMLDARGYVASWNPGAQRIKGYRPDEILGAHFSRFYTDEDRQNREPERALDTAVRDGRYEKEAWRVRKDGTRFWANVVIDAIHNDQGAVIGFAKITRDITERRDAQLALDQAREALMQSQKMEAIGQLTGGVAHDFNNLLTAILGSLELLRKRLPDDPRAMALLDNATIGAERGAALTQRMLAFARRQELKPEPTDVLALVRGMTGLLRQSLGPMVSIETRFPLVLNAVQADANQLESALLNLTVNARDAMPEGGSIILAAREEAVTAQSHSLKPGRYVCLSVEDAGEGMDEAVLAKVREPFFTTKGPGKGTGLGLSMVDGMMAQLGGELVIKSRKGEGTTVELWLPVAEAKPEAPVEARPSTGSETGAICSLVVLAVDDDSLVLMNTVAMLEDLGHRVFEAGSAKQALEILRREVAIDLVITDQAMPQMTGLELVDAITRDWPSLPIIVATGYAELSANAYATVPRLEKPYRQADLARAIADTIQAKRVANRVLKFRAR